MPALATPLVRLATVLDILPVIALIDACLREYGDQVCLERGDAELRVLDSYYAHHGGGFWVAEVDGAVVGTVALKRVDGRPGCMELKRMYLAADQRGTGLAQRLHAQVTAWASGAGCRQMVLWSDARFTRAHAFYRRLGYTPCGLRHMDDGLAPYDELGFERALVERT